MSILSLVMNRFSRRFKAAIYLNFTLICFNFCESFSKHTGYSQTKHPSGNKWFDRPKIASLASADTPEQDGD
jgi:hypothetical protein